MPNYHKHICGCGDYYVCSNDPDKCEKDWECPACITEQLDSYYRSNPHQATLEFNADTEHEQKPEPLLTGANHESE